MYKQQINIGVKATSVRQMGINIDYIIPGYKIVGFAGLASTITHVDRETKNSAY